MKNRRSLADASKDYYDILWVISDASIEEINSNFRKKAKEAHPDINSDPW